MDRSGGYPGDGRWNESRDRYDDRWDAGRDDQPADGWGTSGYTAPTEAWQAHGIPVKPRQRPARGMGRWNAWLMRRFPTRRGRRIFLSVLVLGISLFVLVPAVSGTVTFLQLKKLESDAVYHLYKVKDKLPSSSANIGSVLNQATIQGMQPDITAAQNDFIQLRNELNSSPVLGTAALLPGVSAKIEAARHLASVGLDATRMGTMLVQVGLIVAQIAHSKPLTATTPVITQAQLDSINGYLTQATPLIDDIAAQLHGVDLSALLSSSQISLISKFTANLPQIQQDITLGHQFIAIAPSLFGLGKPTTYLMVAMDRSELRASGGFQGNFALITTQDGHLNNGIHLNDTYLIDEAHGACWNSSSTVPQQYSGWWPFHCWGLRDASISADFPTTAKTSMSLYNAETGKSVSGFIAVTPVIIEQLLSITGNIHIGYDYNVTVTPSNLESLIHKYQLTATGISAGNDLPPPDQISSTRKRFTALLGDELQTQLHGLDPGKMASIIKFVIGDLKTKDVQVYFTDPKVEQFFVGQHLTSAMYRGPGDGLYVVDSNLSGKESTMIQENFTDKVQLDASGGATHTLTISYNFPNPNNLPTYGYGYGQYGYRDYLRVYVDPHSQLQNVATNGPSSNAYYYPAQIGALPSDEPARTMFAGTVFVPMNAGPVTITLVWYVPHIVPNGGHYTYVIQRQAGMSDTLDVTIYAPNGKQPVVTYATPKGQTLEKDVTLTY